MPIKRKYRRRSEASKKSLPPLELKDDYKIDKIVEKVDLTGVCDKFLYRVRWPKSWEPASNLRGVDAFEKFRNGIKIDKEFGISDKTSDDSEKWDVHRVIRQSVVNGEVKYYVQWKDSWIWSKPLQQSLVSDDADITDDIVASIENNNNIVETEKKVDAPLSLKRKREDDIDGDDPTQSEEIRKSRIQNFLDVIIDDEEIDRIISFGVIFDERMFLIQRLNGEQALIPTKVAKVKYTNAVFDFYEKHLKEL